MDRLIEIMNANRATLMWVSGASVAMFVGSLLLVPFLVARAPEDFFVREQAPQRSAGAVALRIVRNLVGVVLLLAGVLMLILPGQGLLVLLIGLSLVDLPGKRALVRRIVQKPPVWRALGYLRKRADKPPFIEP